MTIYLTPQSEWLAARAVHRHEVNACVREAQRIVNRAARAQRANAPGEQTMASIRAERTKLALTVFAVCAVVAVLGAVALCRWRAGLGWS